MHLLRPEIAVFAVQLYWISIVFIGWSLVKTLLTVTKGSFIRDWQRLPIAAKFVISTAVAFALFCGFTVIGYALSLPPWWLNLTYIASLLYALYYNYKNRPVSPAASIKMFGRAILDVKLISPLGILLILAVIDLFLTFFIGGFMGADGFVHISKIRHLTLEGFTLTDAYYGTVPETRHTVSVMHTIVAIPSAFGVNPITSWYASAVFFKLVKFCAIFYLAWKLMYRIKGGSRIQYAALATILPLAIYNNYFISYPSYFVATWVLLFTVALLDVTKRQNHWLLFIAGTLIAFTHPLAAIACSLLLVLVVLGWLIVDQSLFTKQFSLMLLATFTVLLSTPLFTATLPNQMTDAVRNFGAKDMTYYRLGSLTTLKPTDAQYFDTQHAMFWPLAALSALGIIGLFVFIKDRRYRCVIGGAVLLVPLILYDPITFSIITKQLPVWAVARFNVANQLTLFMAFFGLMLLIVGIPKLLKLRISTNVLTTLLLAAVSIIFICFQTYGAVDVGTARNLSMFDQQESVLSDMQNIQQVLPNDKYAIVLAERTWDSFIIPVVAPLHVVAIHDNNSTPAADMVHRSACYDMIYASLNPALTKQAGVKYVLARKSETVFYSLAASDPNLRAVKHNSDRTLYKFNDDGIKTAHSPACHYNE